MPLLRSLSATENGNLSVSAQTADTLDQAVAAREMRVKQNVSPINSAKDGPAIGEDNKKPNHNYSTTPLKSESSD